MQLRQVEGSYLDPFQRLFVKGPYLFKACLRVPVLVKCILEKRVGRELESTRILTDVDMVLQRHLAPAVEPCLLGSTQKRAMFVRTHA